MGQKIRSTSISTSTKTDLGFHYKRAYNRRDKTLICVRVCVTAKYANKQHYIP